MTDIGDAVLSQQADGSTAAKVSPGGLFVTRRSLQIITVLGSCVSACIRDPHSGVSGMNHFMLPVGCEAASLAWAGGSALRYGNVAMDTLLKGLNDLGAGRQRLEVKLFGGGRLFGMQQDIGAANVRFVLKYLNERGLEPSAMDVGAEHARKIVFDTASGAVRLKRLNPIYDGYITSTEKELLDLPNGGPPKTEGATP